MTNKTPPHLENSASFGNNEIWLHNVAKFHANYSKNFAIYFGRNHR